MTRPGHPPELPWERLGDRRLRDILDAAPVGVMITTHEGRLLWLNRALRRQLDVIWPDVIGTSLDSLPLETAVSPTDGIEIFRIATVDPAHPVNLRASSMELGLGEDEPPLTLRFFVDAGRDGEGLRLSVLQHLETRRGRDPQTGVLDRNAVLQVLDEEVARSRRYSNPLSLVVLRVRPDLHDGKPEAVVIAAGRILSEDLRWVDVAGRISDTEFLLLLPETDLEGAKTLADKLRARFSAQHDARPPVAASIVAASWRKGDDVRALLGRAMARLDAHRGLS